MSREAYLLAHAATCTAKRCKKYDGTKNPGALHSLADFLDCTKVKLARTSPQRFKPALLRALATHPGSGERS